jgi:trimeric autotransporter adhesin
MQSPMIRLASMICVSLAPVVMFLSTVAAQCVPQWQPGALGTGLNGPVHCAAVLPNGNVIVGGSFTSAGGVATNRIARWNGSSWAALGTGFDGTVRCLAVLANGNIIAGGEFANAGGVATRYIARWTGVAWTTLAGGMNREVRCLAVLSNGHLIAGGDFGLAGGVMVNYIARWNGSVWSPMSSSPSVPDPNSAVNAMTVLPNDHIAAGGSFGAVGGIAASRIAIWNGSQWSALGSGLNADVHSLLALPNGNLIAGGDFSAAGAGSLALGKIARWDGTTWSPIASGFSGPGTIRTLAVLPGGDLLAGGDFLTAGGLAVNNLARWGGSGWEALGPGLTNTARVLVATPGDTVFVGGDFTNALGLPTIRMARLTTTCPASVTSFGTGCTGSAGLNALSELGLPWLGTTWRGRATGMPATSFAVAITGFSTTSLPLSSVLPIGLPGCTARVAPDLLDFSVSSAGQAITQLALPPDPLLLGGVLHHQVAALELGAALDPIALTSTNALTLTIGGF